METKTAREPTSFIQQAKNTLEPLLREKWSAGNGFTPMELSTKVTTTTISPRVRVNGTSKMETPFRVLIDRQLEPKTSKTTSNSDGKQPKHDT